MKMNFKELLTNFSFVIISNLTNLLISSLAILIIPKVIGVREYGYWQLYAFYISYAGFFHLGWPDGIYLRYGGVEYENLDKDYFFKQIILYNIYLFIVTGFVLLFVNLNNFDTDKSFIYYMASCNIILLNIRVFFVLLLQATNEIKKVL
nr:hypothetical protein [Globicatella sp. PHS-GS-PNBC-21-1553]